MEVTCVFCDSVSSGFFIHSRYCRGSLWGVWLGEVAIRMDWRRWDVKVTWLVFLVGIWCWRSIDSIEALGLRVKRDNYLIEVVHCSVLSDDGGVRGQTRLKNHPTSHDITMSPENLWWASRSDSGNKYSSHPLFFHFLFFIQNEQYSNMSQSNAIQVSNISAQTSADELRNFFSFWLVFSLRNGCELC